MPNGNDLDDPKEKSRITGNVREKQAKLQKLLNDPSTDPERKKDIQLEINVLEELCHFVALAYSTRSCKI